MAGYWVLAHVRQFDTAVNEHLANVWIEYQQELIRPRILGLIRSWYQVILSTLKRRSSALLASRQCIGCWRHIASQSLLIINVSNQCQGEDLIWTKADLWSMRHTTKISNSEWTYITYDFSCNIIAANCGFIKGHVPVPWHGSFFVCTQLMRDGVTV